LCCSLVEISTANHCIKKKKDVLCKTFIKNYEKDPIKDFNY